MALNGKQPPFQVDPELMNLSLNGCGYLGIYHVGVCSCIKKFYPQALRGKIAGGSVGALVACAFMCDVPLDICAKYVFDVSMKVRNAILGPMSPDLNIMKLLHDSMDAMLPSDAHVHCDNRLHVSTTRFQGGGNTLLSSFKSREELLQALMCSCFIPFYCGYQPPEFYGVAYCDAALSNNSPCVNKYTVTVAPFSGNSDICPQNDGFLHTSLKLSNTSIGINAKNMYMLFRVLFPASPEVQKDICQQGYNDALRYLRDNNLIPCQNCVSAGPIPNHAKCNLPEGEMPKAISNEIEIAVLGFRKKLSYRLLQRRPVKMLYYLNMPSIMTIKVSYVLMTSLIQLVQLKAGLSMDDIWGTFLNALKNGLYPTNNSTSSSNQSPQKEIVETSTQVKQEYLKQLEANRSVLVNEAVMEIANDTSSDEELPHYSVSLCDKKDTNVDRSMEFNIAENVPKNYPSMRELVSIPMTSYQACQLEKPYSKNKIDTPVNEYMKTCVF